MFRYNSSRYFVAPCMKLFCQTSSTTTTTASSSSSSSKPSFENNNISFSSFCEDFIVSTPTPTATNDNNNTNNIVDQENQGENLMSNVMNKSNNNNNKADGEDIPPSSILENNKNTEEKKEEEANNNNDEENIIVPGSVITTRGNMELVNFDEAKIVLRGVKSFKAATAEHVKKLRSLGGNFSRLLPDFEPPHDNFSGWIFPQERKEEIQKWLENELPPEQKLSEVFIVDENNNPQVFASNGELEVLKLSDGRLVIRGTKEHKFVSMENRNYLRKFWCRFTRFPAAAISGFVVTRPNFNEDVLLQWVNNLGSESEKEEEEQVDLSDE